jgi:MinD-like ATPase involved in chromosome partitioning or flagellar assembly
MTIVVFASLKGAPGVTTLTSLVGAMWPDHRKVLVVECDPSGGDLAARFQLSSRHGWASWNAAERRSGGVVAIGPHLQQLPGGLDVLVASRGPDVAVSERSMAALLAGVRSSPEGPWDVLVDLGRLPPGIGPATVWSEHADAVVICTHRDAASLVHVRDRSAILLDGHGARVGLAIVGDGGYSMVEIAQFTGLPVVGEIPQDPESAAAAGGERGGGRRLRRSLLAATTSRLAAHLADDHRRADPVDGPGGSAEDQPDEESAESRIDQARSGFVRLGFALPFLRNGKAGSTRATAVPSFGPSSEARTPEVLH